MNARDATRQTDDLRAMLDQMRSLAADLRRTEDRERKRLATDLHDQLVQYLVICRMKLGLLGASTTSPQSMNTLNEAKKFLDEALKCARTTIADLRPMMLGDADDLQTAIDWVVEKMQRQGLKVSVENKHEQRSVNEERLVLAYQAIHELLTNVLKHADTREASLQVRQVESGLEITVADRGKGFDVSRVHDPAGVGGFGLIGIRERVQLLGGRLELSSDSEKGTSVRLLIPL
jgi:signal transduction histidine kinase